MRGLESRRKVLDYKSDNESVRQDISQKLGNRSGTLRPEDDVDKILEELRQSRESLQYGTNDGDSREESVNEREEQAKLERLKRALFSEQEAGKATIYSSLDEKEGAEAFESEISRSIRDIMNELDSL